MCQQKLKGWLLWAWDGKKVKIKFGSSVLYSKSIPAAILQNGGEVDLSLNLYWHFCA